MEAKELCQRLEQLQGERGTFDSLWQDVATYCVPRKAIINTYRSMGSELTTEVYDSTGRTSSQIFAAGLHGYLTNPASKWFKLGLKNVDNSGDAITSSVDEWLHEVETVTGDVINNSNFSQQVYECYRDLGIFGTATLAEEEDEKDHVRFHARPINEIYISEDSAGRVVEVYRIFLLTAKQAVDTFGDKVSPAVKENATKNPNKKIEYLHWVGKRDIREAGKEDSINKPYASVWVEVETKRKVGEGGYEEFPFFVVRFQKNSMEKYGYSPAITVLPDMRMVNKMKKTILQQAEKMVDPPLDAPDEGYVLPLDISSGAINYHRQGIDQNNLIRPLLPDISRGLPITLDMIKDTQETIKGAFFVDLFLMLAGQPKMTATEVMQRVNEKMVVLSPVLGRLTSEFLDSIIHRTIMILMRRGVIPPAPPELQGKEYVIEYISPLARAQKAFENNSMQQFIGVVAEMMQMSPEAVDVVNIDKVIREYGKIQDIPPSLLRSDGEVEQIRQERQQQAQQMQQLEAAKQGSEVVKNISQGRQ